jgi:glycine reductase
MSRAVKVVHYLNQFFGGIGGEEQAYAPVQVRTGAVGPGQLLQRVLGDRGSVVATIIAGDNYMAEERDSARAALGDALARHQPDILIAGPAFDAGRYGLACAEACLVAQSRGIAAVTGMHPENPGVLTRRRELLCAATGAQSSEMAASLQRMAELAFKVVQGQPIGPAQVEGYVPTGVRRSVVHGKRGYERAVEMLKRRLAGERYTSEMLLVGYDRVPPAQPVTDLRSAAIALVSTGGLVPRGNPDRLVSGRAEQFFRYDIQGLSGLTVEDWESVHGGFSTHYLNTENPNYALPLNVVRRLESEGAIESIYPVFFSTTGNGTAVSAAMRMGREIAGELSRNHVKGALLVAT